MTKLADQMTEVAKRLWTEATATARTPGEVIVAVEHLFYKLREGLLPWAGGDGYRALLDRAVGEVEIDEPMLAGLTFLGGDARAEPSEDNLAQDRNAIERVTIALVTALVVAFGRFVGDGLALRLVDQVHVSGAPGPNRHPDGDI